MSSFKSPQLHVCGKIKSIIDSSKQDSSFYVKAQFIEGEDWKLLSGITKFQTFQSETVSGLSPIQHPFNIHYITHNVRGWPRLLVQAWKVDEYGRHKLEGYGTVGLPMSTGQHQLEIPCWKPMGTWYDWFIGASSQLQNPGVMASSLNRYGLRTFSGCLVKVEMNIIGRNFQVHGVLRE